MKKNLILVSLFSVFLLSCSNLNNQKSNGQLNPPAQQEHEHNNEAQIIELNNGVKWKVDDNMLLHIRNLESDVQVFPTSGKQDHKILAGKLQKNIDLLTSNCTMKGKAHDELHKWLLPFIDLVNLLSETDDPTEAAKHFHNIQTSFITFNRYFE